MRLPALALLCCAAALAEEPPMAETRQYRTVELTLTAAREHPAPLDVTVTATFRGPDGATLTREAFFDGERTWRIRFAALTPGRWTWRTTCSDAADPGLHDQSGGVAVGPAAGDNPLDRHGGWLRVSADRRYLTYTDGTPFFWLADTWWFCPSDLMPFDRSNRPDVPAMYRGLVDLRARQRYTVVQMNSLGSLTTGEPHSGVAGSYASIFAGQVDVGYWRAYDRYLAYAAAQGLLPFIGFGFHQGLNQPSLTELQRLWRYVLARYGAQPVGWLICGEYNQHGVDPATKKTAYREIDQARVAKILALGAWIKEHDAYRRALTVHPWALSVEGRQAWDEAWYDFIMVQGGHGRSGPDPSAYRRTYDRAAPKPLLEGEVTYERIHGYDDTVVRRNAWKAIQSGAFGFSYGAHGLWYPTQDAQDQKFADWGTPVPWWEAMHLPGGAQMTHLRAIYEQVPWWRLAPVEAGDLLHSDAPPDGRWPPLWVKADGLDHVVIYAAPHEQPRPALRLRALTGTFQATLYDPRTGEARPPVRASSAAGLVNLPPWPDQQDWVMVVRREESWTRPG